MYGTLYISAVNNGMVHFIFLLYTSVWYTLYFCCTKVYGILYISAIHKCMVHFIFLLYTSVWYTLYFCCAQVYGALYKKRLKKLRTILLPVNETRGFLYTAGNCSMEYENYIDQTIEMRSVGENVIDFIQGTVSTYSLCISVILLFY